MKEKLSISMDSETVALIRNYLQDGTFRNVSHAVEYCVLKIIGGSDDEKKK
jgi:Arc/MetJ-type ribon-helix-helix transcriptional regulator